MTALSSSLPVLRPALFLRSKVSQVTSTRMKPNSCPLSLQRFERAWLVFSSSDAPPFLHPMPEILWVLKVAHDVLYVSSQKAVPGRSTILFVMTKYSTCSHFSREPFEKELDEHLISVCLFDVRHIRQGLLRMSDRK